MFYKKNRHLFYHIYYVKTSSSEEIMFKYSRLAVFTGPANSMIIDFFKFTYLTRFGYKLILIAKYFTHRSPTISAVLLLRGDPKTIKK